jgi:hypothetical protein
LPRAKVAKDAKDESAHESKPLRAPVFSLLFKQQLKPLEQIKLNCSRSVKRRDDLCVVSCEQNGRRGGRPSIAENGYSVYETALIHTNHH